MVWNIKAIATALQRKLLGSNASKAMEWINAIKKMMCHDSRRGLVEGANVIVVLKNCEVESLTKS